MVINWLINGKSIPDEVWKENLRINKSKLMMMSQEKKMQKKTVSK